MKIDPHLPNLPSVTDLLADPRVKRLMGRIHQSTLAQRATSFLDELRAHVAARASRAGRVEEFSWPSLGQLAERFAQRLLGAPTEGTTAINATGLVVGNARYAPPLAEAAIHAMLQQAGDYADRARQEVIATEALCALAGCEQAATTSNYDAALMLLMASAGAGGAVLVIAPPEDDRFPDRSRGALDSTCDPVDWQALGRSAGVVVRRVGSSQLADSPRGTSPYDAQLWVAVSAPPNVASSASSRAPDPDLVRLAALASQAHAAGARLINAALWAGAVDPGSCGYTPIATLAERIGSGVDAVAADGAGLVGGPSMGLVLGASSVLESARRHVLWPIAAAGSLSNAALAATLELYRQQTDAFQRVPLWQLLSTPLENLRTRSERLAPLLAELPDVVSASARQWESSWLKWGNREWTGQSWGVAVRAREGSAEQLWGRLQHLPVALVGRHFQDEVQIDMRGVIPRWDHQLESLWGANGDVGEPGTAGASEVDGASECEPMKG